MRCLLALFSLALVASLPTNFDARNQWTKCAFFILNQEQCGSCWDFCSVESFADRLCINGEAPSGTIISPEPILECSRQGCNGGNPSTAWNWIISNGDTTCTSQCFKGCAPYDSGSGTSPACHNGKCDSGSAWPVTYHAGSFKSLSGISTFQTELYDNGPLQACFNVYNNFYTFFDDHPDGIYTSYSGGLVGGHCVKMVGWGVDGSTDYWTFANSWDTTWANQGYFKMLKGSNLCGIEGSVSEGFTKAKAAELGIFGIHENVNTSFIVGGWHRQDDLSIEFVQEAITRGKELLSQVAQKPLHFEEIISVETQVVAGVNFRVHASVEGQNVVMRIHRDLKFNFHLREHNFKL